MTWLLLQGSAATGVSAGVLAGRDSDLVHRQTRRFGDDSILLQYAPASGRQTEFEYTPHERYGEEADIARALPLSRGTEAKGICRVWHGW